MKKITDAFGLVLLSPRADEDFVHRLYVLYRLPTLKFLDAMPVTDKELQEAQRRGAYCVVARPAEVFRSVAC